MSARKMETNETLIRITYGYSRDHRADLKQWQLSPLDHHERRPHWAPSLGWQRP